MSIDSIARGLAASTLKLLGREQIERILRNAARAALSNAFDLPAMASPPTIVDNDQTHDAALSRVYWAAAGTPLPILGAGAEIIYSAFGATPTQAVLTAPAAGRGTVCSAFEFFVDADVFETRLRPPSAGKYIRFVVDGQYVSKTYTSMAFDYRWFKWTFASRGVHHIRIETEATTSLAAIALPPSGAIWAPQRPRALITFGDSYTFGTGANNVQGSYATTLAKLLGFSSAWNCGIGGTGWLANASGAQQTFIQGIDTLTKDVFDLVVFAGGINDVSVPGYTTGSLTAAVAATLQAARARTAAPIVVLGPWTGSTGPSATILAAEDAIQAGVVASGITGVYFIPVARAVPTAPIYGTGKVGSTNGSGNSDVQTSADGTHPVQSGHDLLGRWTAQRIVETLVPG